MDSFNSWESDLMGMDAAEAARMAPFAPRVQGQEQPPWWQSIVQYGLVRAIDNTLPGRSPGIAGNTSPGSFAGQNGGTYTQTGPLTAPPQRAAAAPTMGGLSPVLLIGAAVALFLALKR